MGSGRITMGSSRVSFGGLDCSLEGDRDRGILPRQDLDADRSIRGVRREEVHIAAFPDRKWHHRKVKTEPALAECRKASVKEAEMASCFGEAMAGNR